MIPLYPAIFRFWNVDEMKKVQGLNSEFCSIKPRALTLLDVHPPVSFNKLSKCIHKPTTVEAIDQAIQFCALPNSNVCCES